MNLKMSRVFASLFILIGIIMFFVPSHIAPVCPLPKMEHEMTKKSDHNGAMEERKEESVASMQGEKKMPMRCHHTGNAIKGVGVVIALSGIVFVFIGNKDVKLGICSGNIGLGVLPVIFVHLIGVCMHPGMSCRTYMVPAVYLLSGLYIILNIVFIVRNRK